MKVLFVCGKNTVRSLTAEKLYQKTTGVQVRSAGTERSARVKVTVGDIGWAETIYVFEKSQLRDLKERFGEVLAEKEILVLHISNPGGKYTLMDERLVAKIQDAVGELGC
ncbi:hypothetical protein [Armatimonas sp.]|uniref:arsenate reductase/protein-tyrosine-phosphatase family protein n=1 Tax=Armatimonas sp. TaxID=1872638 RepID=UPI00286C40BF|nr:hypothetical protein [Armatimonas sp.]